MTGRSNPSIKGLRNRWRPLRSHYGPRAFLGERGSTRSEFMPSIVNQAADVARIIVQRHGPIDQTKLQKLLYYSQALSLVWFNEELFPEPIEAWVNGPVVAAFWRRHAYESALSDVPEAADINDVRARSRAEAVVDAILKAFGSLTGAQLSMKTHNEQPWIEARGSLPPGARSTEKLDLNRMRDFYAKEWGANSH